MLPLILRAALPLWAARSLLLLGAGLVGVVAALGSRALGASPQQSLRRGLLWTLWCGVPFALAPLPPEVPFTLTSYWPFDIAAFAALVALEAKFARDDGLDPRVFVFSAPVLMVSAVAASRLFYFGKSLALGQQALTPGAVVALLAQDRGVNTFGVLLGAVGVSWLVFRSQGLDPRRGFDVLFSAAPLGFAIAKLGCFFTGCCYGHRAAWGVTFPRETRAWFSHVEQGALPESSLRSLPVIPVQLLEFFVMAAVFLALLRLRPRLGRPGQQTGLSLTAYGLVQLGFELVRADPERGGPLVPGGPFPLSVSLHAWMALAVLAVGLWVLRRSRGSRGSAAGAGQPGETAAGVTP